MNFWDEDKQGFLLSPGDRTSCGGYILENTDLPRIRGINIACEGDEYICGLDGQRYKIEGGVPNGSHIEVGRNLIRNTFKNAFDDDIDYEGRKITPASERLRKMQEESGLQRRSYNSLRNFNEIYERDDFIGSAGGIIPGRKRIITGDKENKFLTSNFSTGVRTRISRHLFDTYTRMGKDLSGYETEIICLLAGSAHSRGSCKCHCRFTPRFNLTYRYDEYLLSSFQSVNNTSNSKPETPPVRHQRPSEARQSVEPGFCVVPDQTSPKKYECELIVNPPSGVRELYRQLNPERGKKPGSILIVADPEKIDTDKINHIKVARDKIDLALAPLTNEEAKILFENRTPVDIFASNLYSDALGTSGDILGYIKDAGGNYYEEINKKLNQIQGLYQRTYSENAGRISGEEFFGQRKRLFKELDAIMNRLSKEQLDLKQYDNIKQALGLSTKSIIHKWDQTGINDIEGYASYIEKSAKLFKIMKTVGYVGVGLDFASYTTNVYDACAKGRESECRKAAISEYSKFGGKQTASMFASGAAGTASRAVCMWAMGFASAEFAGAGAALCLAIGTGAGILAGKGAEKYGEKAGEYVGEIIINSPEKLTYSPETFMEESGILIYEKLFDRKLR
ncbi:TPA: hypothetical protein ACYSGQ_001381 [Citrobacter freundii]|uniref:hypothetical protein n=1 Tax=Citrobacter freundii TaxID=546 RepID=UPI001D019108|nr:hypothetical protein [Citrobacter freundii]